jgi:hypothetical protein
LVNGRKVKDFIKSSPDHRSVRARQSAQKASGNNLLSISAEGYERFINL